MKENKFIDIIKNSLPDSHTYIGDDTAYISDRDLLLTQDTLIENVHFRTSTISPYDLGIKSIAVNLSDIAASGGEPKYILISLSMPENINEDFISQFYKGVNYISTKNNVLVVGGDLTRASDITVSIAVIGFTNGINPASRSNAKIGDYVIVTGEFGSSRAGLWILENRKKFINFPKELSEKFIKAHINPIPRLKEGRNIVKCCRPNPCLMDASDGLADALYKICIQSKVSMEINYNNIPIDNDIKNIAEIAEEQYFKWVLYGGEDYELVGTASEECFQHLKKNNIPVKTIGKVISSNNNPAAYIDFNGTCLKLHSNNLDAEIFSHFG